MKNNIATYVLKDMFQKDNNTDISTDKIDKIMKKLEHEKEIEIRNRISRITNTEYTQKTPIYIYKYYKSIIKFMAKNFYNKMDNINFIKF